MRLIPYFRTYLLLATGGLSSLSYGQRGVPIPCPVYPVQHMFSMCCDPAQTAVPDFRLWTEPPKRILGLNVSPDCLPHALREIQEQPTSLEEWLCPKGCQLCGVVHDKGTSVHVCTKG